MLLVLLPEEKGIIRDSLIRAEFSHRPAALLFQIYQCSLADSSFCF
jgi:hypothetical protein